MNNPAKRPVYLDLLRIRYPVNAVVSVGHRISGVLLFLALTPLIYLLELSLRSPEDYRILVSFFGLLPVKLLGVALLWMFVHHLLAGIRLLFIDLDRGVDKKSSRRSALMVLFSAAAAAALTAAGWLL